LVKNGQGKNVEAVRLYEKALKNLQKTRPANHLKLAASYNDIGEVYQNMGKYSTALSYYKKALEIFH
jgi:tetratricopeptide (TPR) repeat protein